MDWMREEKLTICELGETEKLTSCNNQRGSACILSLTFDIIRKKLVHRDYASYHSTSQVRMEFSPSWGILLMDGDENVQEICRIRVSPSNNAGLYISRKHTSGYWLGFVWLVGVRGDEG